MDIVHDDFSVLDSGADGIADSLGLFVDLLEHEVLIAALFRGGHLPGDMLYGLLDVFAVAVVEMDAGAVHDQQVTVVEIHHIPGVFQNGGHIGGDVVAVFAETEDQGRVLLDADDGVGIVLAQHAQGVAALHALHGLLYGGLEVQAHVVEVFDEVGNHFRVGFRLEAFAPGNEQFFQFQIVFNDAVVDHGDLTAVRHVGVAVGVGRCAVGGPSGVADADGSV